MRFSGSVGYLILLAVVFTACEEDRFFNIDAPDTISFASDGAEQSFRIDTNMEWSVSSSQPWCGVTPSSGVAAPDGQVVKIVCEPNDLPDPRQCVLTFISGESVVKVNINQDLKTVFSVSETNFEVSHASSKIGVGVFTTEDYDVAVSSGAASWLSVISTRALNRDSVYFAVAENDTYSSRRGEVVLTQRLSGKKETIVINQKQTDFLGVLQSEFEVGSEGETIDLEVTSNISWEVVIPKDAKSWLKVDSDASTKALSHDHLRLAVSTNGKYTSREALVTIRQKGGDHSTEVLIKQMQKDYISVSTKKYTLTKEAQSLDLKVSSNVEWEILVPDEAKNWLSATSATLTIKANTELTDRQAWIYLVNSGGTLRDSVSITQQRDVVIKVKAPSIVSASKQYVEVTVEEANADYDVKPSVSWISYDKSRSQYPWKLVLYVSAILSDMSREGTVVLRQRKGDGSSEFTIRQRATTYLKALADTIFVGDKASEATLEVNTNVPYKVVVPEDCHWLSVTSAPQVESRSDVSVKIKVDQNSLFVGRNTTLELCQLDGPSSRKVVVCQSRRPLDSESEYIAVFGDIQFYTNAGRINLFKRSLGWISDEVDNGYKFQCVLHTGDVTHNSNLNLQWKYFWDAISGFYRKVPFISAIGDHDYNWSDGVHIDDRNDTYFNWFLSLPTSKVIARFEPKKMENVVIANYIHGEPYYVLCLEFGPRVEVVEWASQFVSSHPDIKFILLNHEYMENGGGLRVKDLKCKIRIRNSSYTTPTQLWEKLVKPNDNIACVICGHVGSLYSFMSEKNAHGREVPQIQHNIQANAYLNDNWLMLWEFPKNSDYASVKIVNTFSGKLYDDKEELFSFKYRY